MIAIVGVPRRVLAAEWVKLWSVRSTYMSLVGALVLGVVLGLLDTASVAHNWATLTPEEQASFDPVGDSLSGFLLGELAFGVLGVLAVTSEYATGLIRTTFAAVPQRVTVFAAKALVVGAVTLVAGEVFVFVTFLVAQRPLAPKGLGVGLGEPGVLRALSCAGLYLGVVAMVGLGLGALLRHSAGAIATLFGLVYLAYGAARGLESWSYLPDRLLLANAADVLAATRLPVVAPRLPSLGLAFVDLAAYVVLALGLGAWRCTRDG